ncbi:MAG: hypothetical protein IJR82_04520 [Bacilli bacterium]|nr:hypothetical protein [Bacilli bacterium]
MKKYLLIITVSLIVGFLMSNYFLKQYDEYKGIKVYNNGELLYFIEYGEFNSYEELESNTINLENYIYQIDNNKYYVYIGITKNNEVLDKMRTYFQNLNYNVKTKEFYVTNDKFIKAIENNDAVLLLTSDNVVIGEIISQGLDTYEEVVINESKNEGYREK